MANNVIKNNIGINVILCGRRKYLATVRVLVSLSSALIATFAFAQANTSGIGLSVSIPNGYVQIRADDMQVMSTAGPVRWTRVWDGKEWKFNSHWESLSQSWTNMTGSVTGSTDVGSGMVKEPAINAENGCWVMVDEDWTPSTGMVVIDGKPIGAPMAPRRMTPFNRLMGEDLDNYPEPRIVSVDYANLCKGISSLSSPVRDLEALRLKNELYLGEGGRYAYSNRAVLEKRAVNRLPVESLAALEAKLASGNINFNPSAIEKGYRWTDKSGQWIDYNTQGQVVAYGDRNNNTIWLARDMSGNVRGVVDGKGRVIYSLHYTGELLTEVRDYPIAGMARDLPARSVRYQYDDAARLTSVIDVHGNATRYSYDTNNRIVTVADQEGRIHALEYAGSSLVKRITPDGGVTEYEFDYDEVNKQFTSRIIGPETLAGRRTEVLTHNRSGKLVRKTVNGQVDKEIRYDSAARAEIHTNARGFTSRMVFNEFDQMIQHEREDGTTVKYEYSALSLLLTSIIDASGIRTNYEYDTKGNLIKKIEAADTPDMKVTEYKVVPPGRIVGVTTKGRVELDGGVTRDAVLQISYDAEGNISGITDAEGAARYFEHNRLGNIVIETDPRGYKSMFEFDAEGRLRKATDALSSNYFYEYDKAGNLKKETDANAIETLYSYDQLDRLARTISPTNGVSTLQYDAQGMMIAVTDEDGRRSEAEYDNFQRLSKISDGAGNVTRFAYQIPDGATAGILGSLSQPSEIFYPTYLEKRRFDRAERLTSLSVVEPIFGERTTIASYDARGEIRSETDAYGNTEKFEFNSFGQPVNFTDKLGNVSQFKYDARGNLAQVINPRGNIHRFEYDLNDRVVREIFPMGQTFQISYDQSGNIAATIDPNGNQTKRSYDAKDRISEVKLFNADGNLVSKIGYVVDKNDHLVGWNSDSSGITSSALITYDANRRKTGETVTYPGGFKMGYTYVYSQAGKKSQLKWPDGTAINFEYTGNGELTSVVIPDEGSISIGQFKWTAPTQVVLPGGTLQQKNYDGLLNLSVLEVIGPNKNSLLSLTNRYGALLEPTRIVRTDSQKDVTIDHNYTYDAGGRLTRIASDNGTNMQATFESFNFDAIGNRTAHSRVEGGWIYDANNRLIQRGVGENATTYTYDQAGNLLTKNEPGNRVTKFFYNQANRLAEVKNGADDLIARYGYDPMGRRIWKDQYRDREHAPLMQQTRTFFLYADEGLIAEAVQKIRLNVDGSVSLDGDASIVTQYGPRPDAKFTTGILFVKTRNSNGNEVFAYYHHDHLNTPVQATDRLGNIVWAATYEAHGKATIVTPIATADKPTIVSKLRRPGQIEDEETGLFYNYQRDYDPQTGRYVQSDPIGLQGGINTYNYVGGNPLTFIDPTGEIGLPGAIKGAAVSIGMQIAICTVLGGDIVQCLKCINATDVVISAAMGAIYPGWGDLYKGMKNLKRAKKLMTDLGGPGLGGVPGQAVRDTARGIATGKAQGTALKTILPDNQVECDPDVCAKFRLGPVAMGAATSIF